MSLLSVSGGAICVNEMAWVSNSPGCSGSTLEYEARGGGFESYSGHFHFHKLSRLVKKRQNKATTTHNSKRKPAPSSSSTCMRCGNTNHRASVCRSTCNYCQKKGHLERVCHSKKRRKPTPQKRATVKTIKANDQVLPNIRIFLILIIVYHLYLAN